MSAPLLPTRDELLAVVRRFHPVGALDVDPGYDDLPEVRARRAAQDDAPRSEPAWRGLLDDLRARFPGARLLDASTTHLDPARQVRLIRDPSTPGLHLVAWTSLLAPVALVYESHQEPRRPARVHPPDRARDAEGLAEVARLVERHGWRILPWPLAQEPVADVAVGNLLPGEATLAHCLFSSSLR